MEGVSSIAGSRCNSSSYISIDASDDANVGFIASAVTWSKIAVQEVSERDNQGSDAVPGHANTVETITDIPVVHIIDDDEQLRLSLLELFEAVGIHAVAFVDTIDFDHRGDPQTVGCLLLDVKLPGVSGIEFQRKLSEAGFDVPIVFMTGDGDVSTSVSAMKAGAIDFLLKPFQPGDLISAVTTAIEEGKKQREIASRRRHVRECAASLTPREKQVMKLVTDGLMNKQVAYELGISEIMVKLHRGSAMRKMQARSLSDLVRKSELLQ